MNEGEKLPETDLEKLKDNEILKALVESNLIVREGFRVSGNGLLINNLEKLNEKVDKISRTLFFLEKRQEEWFKLVKEKR